MSNSNKITAAKPPKKCARIFLQTWSYWFA
jgi:hypothetical protein